jgi:hypothetical protein
MARVIAGAALAKAAVAMNILLTLGKVVGDTIRSDA